MASLTDRAQDLIEDGNLPGALALLDAHLLNETDDDALRLRARLRLREPGQEHAALDDLARLRVSTDEDGLMRVYLHQQLGEYGEAVALLDTLPVTWNTQHLRGDLYAHLDPAAAIPAYSDALDRLSHLGDDPLLVVERAALLVKRARAHEMVNALNLALADYTAAEQLVPHDPSIAFERGLLLFAQGDLRAALPVCRDALDRASVTVRDALHHRLREDPRRAPLLHALLGD